MQASGAILGNRQQEDRGTESIDPPSKGWNRFVGGLKLIGGTAEAAVGIVGGGATSWTGIGAVIGGVFE
ncbi:MAG TPA: hypothetical protein VF581_12995 [Flavobacterium sp.]|jgi:hypothetical protein